MVVSTLSKMSNLIADKLDDRNSSVTIELGKMTLGVMKKTAAEVAQTFFKTHIGSIRINDQFDVPPDTCLVAQVNPRFQRKCLMCFGV